MLTLERSEFEILVPVPQYPPYSATISLLGGSLVPYYLKETANWSLDIKNLCDSIRQATFRRITSLRHLEHENAKILNPKGELSDDKAYSYEKLQKSFDNLYGGVSSLAEAIDKQPPVMLEGGHTTKSIIQRFMTDVFRRYGRWVARNPIIVVVVVGRSRK